MEKSRRMMTAAKEVPSPAVLKACGCLRHRRHHQRLKGLRHGEVFWDAVLPPNSPVAAARAVEPPTAGVAALGLVLEPQEVVTTVQFSAGNSGAHPRPAVLRLPQPTHQFSIMAWAEDEAVAARPAPHWDAERLPHWSEASGRCWNALSVDHLRQPRSRRPSGATLSNSTLL
mmetsp:Transcript_83376/g.232513  ORF Transcript_83376/g.232513 Transcript_83376/m.232513 type:complete len:172 (-) Transcript_83376:748-1263(-)